MAKKQFNIYEMVNEKILALLDDGIIPWEKPWHGGTACISRSTGKPYSLLNQFLLMRSNPNGGEFATLKQINKEGGKVNKGAKAQPVVFWKIYPIEQINPDTNEKEVKNIPVLRYYNVFNINDTTLEPKRIKEQVTIANPNKKAEKVLKAYWKAEAIKVKRDALTDNACYSPSLDRITLPRIDQFEKTAEYYSTAFHESVHSTGHETRLNRFKNDASVMFGSKTYAKEELIAEVGAFALLNYCGIATESSTKNNRAYIKGWRDAIAKDNKLIVSATGKAEKAVNLITSYSEEA